MELNGGRLERNFIKCRVLSLYAFNTASCAAMLYLSCQKQTEYWHSGRWVKKQWDRRRGFLKKRHAVLLIKAKRVMTALREAVQANNTGTTAYSCYIDLWETVLQSSTLSQYWGENLVNSC